VFLKWCLFTPAVWANAFVRFFFERPQHSKREIAMQPCIRPWIFFALMLTVFCSALSVPVADCSAAERTSRGKDAAYWFDKGALCSTYGNNAAAVKYFQKALDLNPRSSRAMFSQGISYGQLGEFERAIALINRALSIESRNGLYYYGRGRVYLLAGQDEKAMDDFRKAAELGDEDAMQVLESGTLSRQ
jgi:tetratricopeptide (TPR) repeat protein